MLPSFCKQVIAMSISSHPWDGNFMKLSSLFSVVAAADTECTRLLHRDGNAQTSARDGRMRQSRTGRWRGLLALGALSTASAMACSSSGITAVTNNSGSASGSSGQPGNGGAPDAASSNDEASVIAPVGNPEAAVGTDSASSGTVGVTSGTDGAAAGTDSAGAGIDGDGGGAGGDGGTSVTDPGTMGDGVFQIAAPFIASPDMTDKAGVARGRTIQFQMGNSKTFGDGGRAAAVYLPAGYTSGTEIPFMVAQDGLGFSGDVRPLLDNMIADGRLPAMAFVFADPAGQRSVEYDTATDKYYQFVETELLPLAVAQVMMQANLVLNLTKDPEGRGTYGGSSGGAAAFTMGWFHPESYRRILTIWGSFVALQHTPPDFPNGCADYFMKAVPNTTPPKPLRVFIEAGSNDLLSPTWRNANDSMGKALAAKGYHYRYVQAQGAYHEDPGARHQYLPDAMLWLWRGYPITKH
jgi:enterochelin esterase-like enzyme